jgi:hypothetical protein
MTRRSAILANLLLSLPMVTGLLGAASTASAQALANDKMKVTIPFAFSIQNQHFAAGSYSVERISNYALLVHSNTTKHGALLTVRGEDGRGLTTRGHLVFERSAGAMYLTQAWFPESDRQYDSVAKPKRERESAKQTVPDTIEIAAIR